MWLEQDTSSPPAWLLFASEGRCGAEPVLLHLTTMYRGFNFVDRGCGISEGSATANGPVISATTFVTVVMSSPWIGLLALLTLSVCTCSLWLSAEAMSGLSPGLWRLLSGQLVQAGQLCGEVLDGLADGSISLVHFLQ